MSAQVISFSAVLNERRAAAEIAKREESAAIRRQDDVNAFARDLGDTLAAHLVAEAMASVLQAEKEREAATKYVPAYCDPKNDVRGSKYDATRELSTKEISARIRQDIKAAQAAGTLPRNAVFSVKTRSYSGGSSIDVRVVAVPEGFRVTSPAFASWKKQFPQRDAPMAWSDCQSDEARAMLATLNEIRGAYNRDNSDSMVDYFETRFYGSTEIDWQLRRALEAREIEASAGDYWADDAGR